MTNYTTRVRMAPAALIETARGFCAALAEGDAGDGELQTGLVPIGSAPGATPTWYITDGPIAVEMAAAMDDSTEMHRRCDEAGLPATLEQCQQLLAACVIAPGGTGFVLMAEMNLELARPADTDA